MPLPEAAAREPIHRRVVDCQGYRREDGLWDVEGLLEDSKSYDFDNLLRGTVAAGEPVHRMRLRLTLDDDLVIRDVQAVTEAHPYQPCPEATAAYRELIGLAIRPGFRRAAMARVGGVAGCTHLTKLLEDLAVVAFQTIGPLLVSEGKVDLEQTEPRHLDRCHAMRRDGEVVREHYPRWADDDD